jgi:UDP-glucose 4-epimerase
MSKAAFENVSSKRSVLVTGSGGYIGRQVVSALAAQEGRLNNLIACDIRQPPPEQRLAGVEYRELDVRDDRLADLCREFKIDCLVHLAAVVSPGPKSDRKMLHSVDVLGTRNVLECCLAAGVGQLILTSSGAAYGYHPDSPEWLDEQDALRGNQTFAYSDHKRQVEEMLASFRERHPELRQLIFRPGTVLGATTANQITALFEGRFVLGLLGAASPFVLIWDRDVVAAIEQGIFENQAGIFNLAGDGVLTLRQMARAMGKPYLQVPVGPLKLVLWAGKKLGLTGYGPEQVDFLRYRPVLSNRRLKEEFGYQPQKTTRQVFDHYLEATSHG